MEWFNYLLKVSACSVFFFVFYLLVLRRLTFFKINRFYLLFTLLLSFVIPTLHFTIEREVEAASAIDMPVVTQEESTIEQIAFAPIITTAPSMPMEESFDWLNLLPYLYISVVCNLLALASWRLFKLIKHAKQSTQKINGLKLVPKSEGFTNCSFFNYVFIDENNLTENELQVLLRHEEVHVKNYHSVDKILLIIAKAVLWFNPIIYLYDKALEQIHEYEADEVTSQNFGTATYANLLLRLAVTKTDMPLVHNFVKSPIKERIKMLYHSKSKQMKKLMYLLALPIGLGLLWGFTVKVVDVLPKTKTEKEFTLILDAGHGGKQIGATANGVNEKDITLAFANKIKALAEAKGIKVITTRESDKLVSLNDRIKANGDILISLHVNSEPVNNGGKSNGIEMFTAKADESLKSAQANSLSNYLFKGMLNVEGIRVKKDLKSKNLFILKESKVPGLILELGYLTNKSDLKFITNEAKQNELAAAIVNGILDYKAQIKNDGKSGLDNHIVEVNNQDTLKSTKQNNEANRKAFLAWRQSPEYQHQVNLAKEISGKTITGTIGETYDNGKNLFAKGVLFKVADKAYILESGFGKYDISKLIAKNDVLTIKVGVSAFNKDAPYLILSAQTLTKDGKLIYTRPPLERYAFLYEANRARYAWSKIKSINRSKDGTINKIVLNDKGFTINLNVADQKFKSSNFNVGDEVVVKFIREKLIAKDTYTTDKMIALYSWPKKYEIKNPTLYSRFYNEDGTQKVNNSNSSSKANLTGSISPKIEKPVLIRSTNLRVDTKMEVSYAKNGVMKIFGGTLLADDITFDQKNEKVTANKATFTTNKGDVIKGEAIDFDYKKGTYLVEKAKGIVKSTTNSDLNSIEYTASDSVIMNKLTGEVYLFGNAKAWNEKTIFKGDQMVYNKMKQTLKVRNRASLFDKISNSLATADSIDINLKTSTGLFHGTVYIKK